MSSAPKLAVEIWSPLPPQASGVADYVQEQLAVLDRAFTLTLVAQDAGQVDRALCERYRVISPDRSDLKTLRVYHVGNSPLHGFIYRQALRTPGVVVLHEWNLHELLLGFAVTSNDFEGYRGQMRREHGERGSIAAETIASALGGRHWTGVFPLNAEVLESALAVVCLSAPTAARVAARRPGGRVLHLPHHAVLKSHAANRWEARSRLGLDQQARVILAPGLGTASKSLDVAQAAIEAIRPRVGNVVLVTAGGGSGAETMGAEEGSIQQLGRVDLETLGDAILAADVVLALRFPSRGEASGVLMRALAAGRACVVSSGSTADEDLPEGVVARVNPGPEESRELGAVLELLLLDDATRLRMEQLSRAVASTRSVEPLTEKLAGFLEAVATERGEIESEIRARESRAAKVRERFRVDLEAAASSLGLAHVPPSVFERLGGL